MRGFSVLLVDGSVTVRRLLTEAFEADLRVGVVATAATPEIALAKIRGTSPDVVVVDLDPPEGDPFATVRAIRQRHPLLPIVVDSERSHDGADLSVQALEAGATRCVSRPTGLDRQELIERVRQSLMPVLLEVCGVDGAVVVPPGLPPVATNGSGHAARRSAVRPQVLALGASTGGPEALETVLAALPDRMDLPVLVVQHMPAGFTRQFAQRLAKHTGLPVTEARHGDALLPGRVLLAPGGFHMRVASDGARRSVRLDEGTPENFCRPSVDVLFRSLATAYGASCLAVVLTGMGADGVRGAGELVHVGAEVLVQDRDTSTVWGMPGAVSNAGLASETLPLDDIAVAIAERISLTVVRKAGT